MLKCFNPFVPNGPFLYPLKTSENLAVFWCFQGVKKGCIGNEWFKVNIYHSSCKKYIYMKKDCYLLGIDSKECAKQL